MSAMQHLLAKLWRLRWSLLLIAALLPLGRLWAEVPHLDVLRVKGAINPVVAGYISRGIELAEREGALAVVIEMDTPGGLDTSMREIIQRIVSARVPVIFYVSPPGARAASAGAFIAMAAHVTAMAPNTAIGAAHPVAAGSIGGEQVSGEMLEKATNDAAAYIRSLAQERHRNPEWAERAVRESISANEREALQLGVVELVAPDLASLLSQLQGRSVKLATGSVTFETRGAQIRYLDMGLIERFLYVISDPNIAFILLSLAMTGLFLELSNPGAILPGIVGGIFLLLALYSLGMMPVNWAGVLLIVLAFLFFLAEMLVVSHGMLTIGGIISLTLGALILFNTGASYLRVSWTVIALVVLIVSTFFFFVVSAVVGAHRRRLNTGREGLLGAVAVARTPLEPRGLVFLQGERWSAELDDGKAAEGEEVIVKAVDGLKLRVAKKERR